MNSSSTIVASSGVFQIEYLIEALEKDFDGLISVSKSLKTIYGARSVLTKNTITKYFNHPESLPFIARYRNETTLSGGFLDRILDGIGFVFVMSSFSWFTYQKVNEPYYILLGPMVAAFYLVICYSYWTTAYQEQKYLGKTNKVRPGDNVKNIKHISTLKYVFNGQRKILSFKQADFYFWIGFGKIFKLS